MTRSVRAEPLDDPVLGHEQADPGADDPEVGVCQEPAICLSSLSGSHVSSSSQEATKSVVDAARPTFRDAERPGRSLFSMTRTARAGPAELLE